MQEIVAKAIKVEIDEKQDKMFLVFEVVDEAFKKKLIRNWKDDIPMKLMGTSLVTGE